MPRANNFLPALVLLSVFLVCNARPQTGETIVGAVRVQFLSDTLVRLEVRGPNGFEDRPTFHVVCRAWPRLACKTSEAGDRFEIRAGDLTVHVPTNAHSLNRVSVESGGRELFRHSGKLENSRWLPAPGESPQAWWFADTPRLVPPRWGLTSAPAGVKNGGWDLANDAADIYVFIPRGDYRQLRADFLQLTGPTEMPPLFALGAWDSRWFDYSTATALQQIDDYRAHKIPLDVLVVDTGWRVGASVGYAINTNLFPDVENFFRDAHARNAKVMFNDHPEPRSTNALAPEELSFRYAGLSGLLEKGLDVWWFDRNWMTALKTPAQNLCKEVWGMQAYHDATARVRPELRPLIMANVDGIDNGNRRRPPDVAAHRFPIQWTGDTGPGFDDLRRGVENCVQAGVAAAFPYMSEDLGGHMTDPTPEAFIRWIEYGALSPVYRPHCTHNLQRMPWTFGAEAESVARNYLNLRYRLLPTFYAACRENFETGEPLLRRLDLDYPQFNEANADDEFLLGKSILVAPVLEQGRTSERQLWLPPGNWTDAWTGKVFSGPATITNSCPLAQTPIYIKAGAVIALAPEMQFTGEKPWSPVTLDIYPAAGESAEITLYEDDTRTTGYQRGEFRKTRITSSTGGGPMDVVTVHIEPAKGIFPGALAQRSWVLRLHRPIKKIDFNQAVVRLDGKAIGAPVKIPQNKSVLPLGDAAGAPDGDVYQITIPSAPVTEGHRVEVGYQIKD